MSNTPAPAATNPATTKPAGLAGVVAAQSDICFIDGNEGKLVFRGYEIEDLVENTCYEEVCHLLWHGELPTRQQLHDLRAELAANMSLPKHVYLLLGTLPPETLPMDALRTAASALASTDPDRDDNSPPANLRKAIRLTAQFPLIVTAFHKLRNNQIPTPPDPNRSIAGNFLHTLGDGQVAHTFERVMDAALLLHAEHGMNASTFAARVTAATLSDMHAAVTSALAALKGPLHGGANQDVMELLLTFKDGEEAEKQVLGRLARKDKIPGFGHRVYRVFDPRAHFLRRMSKQLCEAAGNMKWFNMQERLIPLMRDTKKSDGTPMNINPNVDFFSATAYYTMGIPLDLFTPIFAIARVAGWTAHIMEQHKNNRIIRPTDDYTGPMGKKTVPLDQRV